MTEFNETADEPDQGESEAKRGPVKHFSQVQFKPIYWTDMAQFKNLIMMNIEVPLFWHLEYAIVPEEGKSQGKRPPRIEPKQTLTANELANADRLRDQVVYLKLRNNEGERAATVFEVADLF